VTTSNSSATRQRPSAKRKTTPRFTQS